MKKIFIPKWMSKYTDIYRKEGFKGLLKKGGLKLIIGFIIFYLIRDVILYILIPYMIARGFKIF